MKEVVILLTGWHFITYLSTSYIIMCHLLFDNISIIYYQKVDFQGDVSECHMNIRLVNNPLKNRHFCEPGSFIFLWNKAFNSCYYSNDRL